LTHGVTMKFVKGKFASCPNHHGTEMCAGVEVKLCTFLTSSHQVEWPAYVCVTSGNRTPAAIRWQMIESNIWFGFFGKEKKKLTVPET